MQALVPATPAKSQYYLRSSLAHPRAFALRMQLLTQPGRTLRGWPRLPVAQNGRRSPFVACSSHVAVPARRARLLIGERLNSVGTADYQLRFDGFNGSTARARSRRLMLRFSITSSFPSQLPHSSFNIQPATIILSICLIFIARQALLDI